MEQLKAVDAQRYVFRPKLKPWDVYSETLDGDSYFIFEPEGVAIDGRMATHSTHVGRFTPYPDTAVFEPNEAGKALGVTTDDVVEAFLSLVRPAGWTPERDAVGNPNHKEV